MKIREITSNDLSAVAQILAEGFPSKTVAYWENALAILGARPKVGDLPQFGLAVEHDDVLQGVMLMIAEDTATEPFCNLSSWYMRPDMRKYAPLLFQRCLKFKGVNYTDCSPAAHVLPIVEKFGFEPYTGGSILVDARAALRAGPKARALHPTALDECPDALRSQVSQAMSYGCQGFLLTDEQGTPTPVLYRTTKLKRLIPVARFVLGDPQLLISQAPGLARALLGRGILGLLIDWPQNAIPATGRLLPEYAVRYCRGNNHPALGDLSNTEIGLFGL